MKKIVTAVLVLAIAASMLAFALMGVNAKVIEGDSPNLLLNYNPSFADSTYPWAPRGTCALEQCDEDSQDGDDASCLVLDRKTYAYSNVGVDLPDIANVQGDGEYELSCWVKAQKKNQTMKLAATMQIQYQDDSQNSLLRNVQGTYVEVGNEWVKISLTFNLEMTGKPKANHFYLYVHQSGLIRASDGSVTNLYNVLVDNACLIKKGSYVEVTPEPDIDVPNVKKVSELERGSKTEIGAIYYNTWYKTSDEWNNNGNALTSNPPDEAARALSPSQFHYIAPFFAQINKSGRVTLPEQTKERWMEEMNYAADAGLTYINYWWQGPKTQPGKIIRYHIDSAEVGAKIKMTGTFMSFKLDDDNKEMLMDAMKKDWWLKYNGMPVIFTYSKTKTDEIPGFRKQVALAGIKEPVYIVAMGATNKNVALAAAGTGYNAVSNYATGAEKTGESFLDLSARTMETNEKLAGAEKTISLIPLAASGRNNNPRIVNPVSWVRTSNGAKPYGGWYTVDPTPEELGTHLLDVLNFNKKNTEACKPNMITIYAWNEHDEGGWLCPTLTCDANGNVEYDSSGSAKRNTERLDAVKQAIDAYRKYEQYPSVIVNYSGEIVEGSVDDVVTPTDNTVVTVSPTAAAQTDAKSTNSWIVWIIIGAIVVIGAVVCTVIIVKKKNTDKTIEEAAKEENIKQQDAPGADRSEKKPKE